MLILLLMCARLSWPSRQLLSARKSTLSYRIVSYRIGWLSVYTARKTPSLCCDVGFTYKCMIHECSFALWYCLCRRPVTYLWGARVSVPPSQSRKCAPHLDLESGNRNNVETTLDGYSDRHIVWNEDCLDPRHIGGGCQVATLVLTAFRDLYCLFWKTSVKSDMLHSC